MKKTLKKTATICMIGAAAGAVNGLFGAGGGMILVPLLTLLTDINEDDIFPTSVAIILPITAISLLFSFRNSDLSRSAVLPCLLGSTIGGILAGLFGKKIPVLWLHRILGILIIWGGIRYLW